MHTTDIEDLHKVVVQGFASVNDRIASVETKLDSLDTGLASVNDRFDALEAHVDGEFGRVKDALLEHGRQLKDIRVALDPKVDRDELEARQ